MLKKLTNILRIFYIPEFARDLKFKDMTEVEKDAFYSSIIIPLSDSFRYMFYTSPIMIDNFRTNEINFSHPSDLIIRFEIYYNHKCYALPNNSDFVIRLNELNGKWLDKHILPKQLITDTDLLVFKDRIINTKKESFISD